MRLIIAVDRSFAILVASIVAPDEFTIVILILPVVRLLTGIMELVATFPAIEPDPTPIEVGGFKSESVIPLPVDDGTIVTGSVPLIGVIPDNDVGVTVAPVPPALYPTPTGALVPVPGPV